MIAWIILIIVIVVAAVVVWTTYRKMAARVQQLHRSHEHALERSSDEHEARLRRFEREAKSERRYAHHGLVRDLLPALDALHEARRCADDFEQPAIAQGIDLALQQIHGVLRTHGMETIMPEPGDAFDPVAHEAVQLVESGDHEPGTIASCLRAGYRQDDRVLRTAMVTVVAPRSAAADTGDERRAVNDHDDRPDDGRPDDEQPGPAVPRGAGGASS